MFTVAVDVYTYMQKTVLVFSSKTLIIVQTFIFLNDYYQNTNTKTESLHFKDCGFCFTILVYLSLLLTSSYITN